jgi:hypothetical protein
MSIQHKTRDSNGEILTGRLWRKNHSFFKNLPFYSDIPRMDEIASTLQNALGERCLEGCYGALLLVK